METEREQLEQEQVDEGQQLEESEPTEEQVAEFDDYVEKGLDHGDAEHR